MEPGRSPRQQVDDQAAGEKAGEEDRHDAPRRTPRKISCVNSAVENPPLHLALARPNPCSLFVSRVNFVDDMQDAPRNRGDELLLGQRADALSQRSGLQSRFEAFQKMRKPG